MVKALNVKTSMLFNLVFASNTHLSCFFFYFLYIDLYFIIHAVCADIFNLIAELVTPIGLSNKVAKVEIKIHPATAEPQKLK